MIVGLRLAERWLAGSVNPENWQAGPAPVSSGAGVRLETGRLGGDAAVGAASGWVGKRGR